MKGRKEKMSKTYKGYELIKAIADGEIKDTKIKWTDTSTGISDLIKISNKSIVWKPETFSTKCLTSKNIIFEPIEDNNIDIDKLTTFIIPSTIKEKEADMWDNRIEINKLIQAVKQLNREIKELKEKTND